MEFTGYYEVWRIAVFIRKTGIVSHSRLMRALKPGFHVLVPSGMLYRLEIRVFKVSRSKWVALGITAIQKLRLWQFKKYIAVIIYSPFQSIRKRADIIEHAVYGFCFVNYVHISKKGAAQSSCRTPQVQKL